MTPVRKKLSPDPIRARTRAAAATSFAGAAALFILLMMTSGCGTPAAPQPPSLRLPETVEDLTAIRTGNTVTLRWTMPKKTTDHLLIATQIHGPLDVRVCTRLKPFGDCETTGESAFAPESEAVLSETLPEAQVTGEPRQLLFFVEVRNRARQSAGLSNSAVIAAGAAPPPIEGLAAELRADGVALRWKADPSGESASVRLHRKLVSPAAPQAKPSKSSATGGIAAMTLTASTSEPVLRDLLVEPQFDSAGQNGSSQAGRSQAGSVQTRTGQAELSQTRAVQLQGALDKTARFGQIYEYTAQRIKPVTLDGKVLELDGDISQAIQVSVVDTFPPAIPQGLAAVAVADEKSIDLSWQPDTEDDLAGYIVYRNDSESTPEGEKGWKRISPVQTSPAFRDTAIQYGHSYRYAVTAIDQTGHESHQSAEAQERLPNP